MRPVTNLFEWKPATPVERISASDISDLVIPRIFPQPLRRLAPAPSAPFRRPLAGWAANMRRYISLSGCLAQRSPAMIHMASLAVTNRSKMSGDGRLRMLVETFRGNGRSALG